MNTKPNTDIMDFDEAIALLHAGAINFSFRNNRGGQFNATLANNQTHVVVTSITEEDSK